MNHMQHQHYSFLVSHCWIVAKCDLQSHGSNNGPLTVVHIPYIPSPNCVYTRQLPTWPILQIYYDKKIITAIYVCALNTRRLNRQNLPKKFRHFLYLPFRMPRGSRHRGFWLPPPLPPPPQIAPAGAGQVPAAGQLSTHGHGGIFRWVYRKQRRRIKTTKKV